MDKAVSVFKDEVLKVIKDMENKFFLFGPLARKENNGQFDIKILISTKLDFSAARKRIEEIEMKMVDLHNVLINSFLYTQREMELKKADPFLTYIHKEGVEI